MKNKKKKNIVVCPFKDKSYLVSKIQIKMDREATTIRRYETNKKRRQTGVVRPKRKQKEIRRMSVSLASPDD